MVGLDSSAISVHWIDIAIIGVYMVGINIAGVYLTRMASKGVDSYFLGGRRIPWWLLGLSGTSCYFDVAGVMWTIAFFYIMGQRFMWIQWEWGFAFMLGFFAAFMGKWLRRSRVVTGAEWMTVRFGTDFSGELARTASAILAIVIAVAFIGFAEYGCGHFIHMYAPALGPHTWAVILMGVTGIYTIAAGLFGVVLTNVIQFCIIFIGSFVLIIKAVGMSSYESVAKEVPASWFEFWPVWRWEHLEQWEISSPFTMFALLTIVWVMKGLSLSFGGPQQLYDMQRFLSARSPREASKAAMLWGVAMTPMFMVSAAVGVIGLVKWGGRLEHPEHLYPVVIGTMLPVGMKGLVLAGLLSAFMSTFSSTVNAGASYLLRDVYQNLFRRKAGTRELVHASRLCGVAIIIGGIAVGMTAKNIDVIFGWIMMTLGTAVLVPNVLRWYWWRYNGMGYAAGTLVGVAAAIAAAIWFAEAPLYKSFWVLCGLSTVSSIAGALLTPASDMATLKDFYSRVRPTGFWGPVKDALRAEGKATRRESYAMEVVSGLAAGTLFQALYLVSTYICTYQWSMVGLSIAAAGICGVILYFTWYRRLPAADEDFETAGPGEF